MKFSNRKGEKLDVDIFKGSELVEPILARPGGGYAVVVRRSTEDLETLGDEAGKAIIANSPNKIFLKN